MPAIPEWYDESSGWGLFVTGLILCLIGFVLMFVLGSRFYSGLIPCVPGLLLMAVDAYEHEG